MSSTASTKVQVNNRRTIAIDWSGAAKGASSKIWLAEVYQEKLVRLDSGRDRAEVVNHVIEYAAIDSETVVGLDFAFSFPRWFANQHGAMSIENVWQLAKDRGEEWLGSCSPPFWGRPGKRRPELSEYFRLTEHRVGKLSSIDPKSVFQIGGVGTVGTGSIRGMPYLQNLRDAGFSIWPFHDVGSRMVIEIYPRLLTGSVNKSDYDARLGQLHRFHEIDTDLAYKAACSEDAFDAAVSAVKMSRHIEDLSSSFTLASDPIKLIEGEIWCPPSLVASME